MVALALKKRSSAAMLPLAVFLVLIVHGAQAKLAVQRIECVPLTECPIYYNLLMQRPVTPERIAMIRRESCGFEKLVEKVWCPFVDNETKTNDVNGRTHSTTSEKDSGTSASMLLSRDNMDKPTESVDDDNMTQKSPTDKEINSNTISKFPSVNECGRDVQNKLFGGETTDMEEFPWTAMIKYKIRNGGQVDYEPACGGALINKRYVLTAAHCVTLREPEFVVLGEYDVRNSTDCTYYDVDDVECAPPPLVLRIENITIHPEWLHPTRRSFYHDIALLRLEQDVEFNTFVAPICLMDNVQLQKGTRLVATGWGITEKGIPSPIKLKVSVPVVTRRECTSRLKVPAPIGPGQICAGGKKNRDTCKGDSGGPLMFFNHKLESWRLAGLVSFGSRHCGLQDAPAIYTWVPQYNEWITETVY